MQGDFEVEAVDAAHALIRMRFTFVAKGRWLTETLLAFVFALRGDILVGDILARWSHRMEAGRDQAVAESSRE
jgi:hypothetical protein